MSASVGAFCVAAVAAGCVWVLRDGDGYVSVAGADGGRGAMPFWSGRSLAATVTRRAPADRRLVPEPVDLEAFLARWLPGLGRDGLRVGVDWSGMRARGVEVEPHELAGTLVEAGRSPGAATGGRG
ncbi:DUF2750 domain-containing protein [Cellulomonas shaoxiangyii]|uniref:DUF2750 domain-containing protein n=1 Tax=Cellulomonas shaoxiangyii TaxID=2566013 RepID=UPI001409B52D|nr:DUF2750 domain-containing protein [Cellulomonas shaoxiangyii]